MTAATAPLVGRGAQMARLIELLDAAAAGAGGMVVLHGEPGAGKTRLVEATAERARAGGFTVRVGRAEDHEVERTLGPALHAFGMQLEDLAGPEVAVRTVLEAGATGPAAFLLADRLLEVVEGQCAAGPVLLAIEDLHWCDAATLTWLRSVRERAAALPLAVVATTRPAAVGTPSRRMLDTLDVSTIALAALAEPDVHTLATALLGHPPDATMTAALASTGGNPLLVHAVADGLLAGPTGQPDGRLGADPLAAHVGELAAGTLRVLQVAAVVGTRVHPDKVGRIVGLTGIDLLGHVDAAVAAGVLHAAADRLSFRHELYRTAVLATLSMPARALLHLQAARVLAAAGAPGVEVAEHFARGAAPGDREALTWLIRAAVGIVGAAPASALRLVEHALRIAGDAPPGELLLLHVRALSGTGRSAEAELLGRSLLRDGLDPATEAALRRELSFTALMQGRVTTCVTEIERCAELSATAATRARVYGETAFARFMALDHEGAQACASRALQAGARCGDIAAQVAGETMLCFLDLFANAVPRAARRAERIVARAELPGAGEAHAFQPWFVASLVWLESDRFDPLTAVARQGREVAVERGAGWAVPGYEAVTAFGMLRAGAFDDAAATAQAALGYLDDVDGLGVAVWCHAFLAQVLLHHDDPDAADVHVSTAEGWLTTERAQLGIEQVQLARATWHERRGDPDGALASLRLAWHLFSTVGARSALPAVAVPLGRLAQGAGDRALTANVAHVLDAAAAASGTASVAAIAELVHAWRDVDPDRALGAATAAAATPRPALAATVLTDAAALLRLRGRHREADRVADDATRRWSVLGAHADAAAAAALSRSARPPAPRPRFGIPALTATERRVVGLLADGLSNSAIAAVLGISRRTVESHVSAAYRKLEVESRVALTRVALAHDLHFESGYLAGSVD